MSLVEWVRPPTSEGYRWLLQADADPQLPARVLALFTVRNELPRYFCARQLTADCVEIEIRAGNGDSDQQARYLARRLLGIPSVIEAGLWAPDGRPLDL